MGVRRSKKELERMAELHEIAKPKVYPAKEPEPMPAPPEPKPAAIYAEPPNFLTIGMTGQFSSGINKYAALIAHIQIDNSLNLVCWDANGVPFQEYGVEPERFRRVM